MEWVKYICFIDRGDRGAGGKTEYKVYERSETRENFFESSQGSGMGFEIGTIQANSWRFLMSADRAGLDEHIKRHKFDSKYPPTPDEGRANGDFSCPNCGRAFMDPSDDPINANPAERIDCICGVPFDFQRDVEVTYRTVRV